MVFPGVMHGCESWTIKKAEGTSLGVKGLRLCASNAGDAGSIPGRGTKIPHATQQYQKINKNIFKK